MLYTIYIIQYTYCISIELYTFITNVRMAPPQVEKQQYVRLHVHSFLYCSSKQRFADR